MKTRSIGPRILVTDGETRSALAVVHSLGRAGIDIIVGECLPVSIAGVSRYCHKTVCYPSPLDSPDCFRDFIANLVQCAGIGRVLPMTDATHQLLAPLRDALPPGVSVLTNSYEQLRIAQDKLEILSLAQRCGIATPHTCQSEDIETLLQFAGSVGYPVVIKPRYSHWLHNGRWLKGGVRYAHDPQQLQSAYSEFNGSNPLPLVQQRIPGEATGVFLLLWNGELKAAFAHRRLRETPPWGGVSTLSESIPLDPELVDKSAALLRTISWQGVAMVEYKRDERDGRAKLMEVNGRFWGSLQLAIAAGMDFPLLLYRQACGEDVPPQFDYRVGQRCRWLVGDLSCLLTLLRAPSDIALSAHPVSKLRACAAFLRGFRPDIASAVPFVGDPRPAWLEMTRYLRAYASRLAQLAVHRLNCKSKFVSASGRSQPLIRP